MGSFHIFRLFCNDVLILEVFKPLIQERKQFCSSLFKAVLKENRPRLLVLKVARIELGNSVANSIKQENKLHLKENSFHRFPPKSLARAISGLLLGDNNVLRKKQSLTLMLTSFPPEERD